MTDRDFKLLVRQYLIAKNAIWSAKGDQRRQRYIECRDELEKRILKELDRFTTQEIESLPFKD